MLRHLTCACLIGTVAIGLATGSAAAQSAGDGGVSDFYVFTDQISGRPGELLRSQALTGEAIVAGAARNVRILYSSTDGLDGRTAVAASGALFLPEGTPPEDGWPLMVWTHGTVGIADICAPSWTGYSVRDKAYFSHWLKRGYAVVAADYQGLGTAGPYPYAAARPEAYSVLDSIRAVQGGAFPISKRAILFGQSQGGAAALAAASHAGTYAPELTIVGLVATGTPNPRVLPITTRTDQVSPLLGFVLMFVNGVAAADPAVSPQDYIAEKAMPAFRLAQTACFPALVEKITADQLSYAASLKPQADKGEKFAGLMAGLMSYASLTFDFPIFIGVGEKDATAPPSAQAQLATAICNAGSRVEWRLYGESDHAGTVTASLRDSTPFVERAFANQGDSGNCETIPAD